MRNGKTERTKRKAKAELEKNKKAAPVVAKPVQEIKAPPKPQVSNDEKKELQKIKSRFGQLETKLVELNKNKTELEAALADPGIYGDKTKFLQAESNYNKASRELEDANKEYEEVFERMMELEG